MFLKIDFIMVVGSAVSRSLTSDLFGELLLTQFVEGVELPAEDLVVPETCTGQFDPHDDGSVWDHHGHCAKLNFQVLWQLLTAGVSGVLEDREATCKVWNSVVGSKVDQLSISAAQFKNSF